MCIEQTGFLVLIADWAEVSSNNLEIGVLSNVILGHLEHPEVEVCDGTKGSACHKNNRLLGWVPEDGVKAVVGKGIVGWICECARSAGRDFGGHHGTASGVVKKQRNSLALAAANGAPGSWSVQ